MQQLISDRSIRLGGSSGLFYYTVLSCYANFRASYKRIDGISYIVHPGEWICRISDLAGWFRVRFQHQALTILDDLQDRHLLTYTVLGHGSAIYLKSYLSTMFQISDVMVDKEEVAMSLHIEVELPRG
ncbi:MAG: hypothetical protein IJZ13_03060 [Clostridia bacterium]|nr:hypothetical protein [Clostridia bacterium]